MVKSVKQAVLETVFNKTIYISLDRPIISFSFDDVPATAATNGAPILEEHGHLGTYYVASGIQSADESNDYFLSASAIKQLVKSGHEIGCHSYSHKSLRWTSGTATLADCSKNTRKLGEIIPDYEIRNFSYPYGLAGLASKRALQNRYHTMRTSDEGLNIGKTDLSHLKAINLYSDSLDRSKIETVLKESIRQKCWVIFYTHDVCAHHSSWGTSLDDFRWVVEKCSTSAFDVLNINHAMEKINRT